jgi:transcriptional regulator with XRE-family HTH domain
VRQKTPKKSAVSRPQDAGAQSDRSPAEETTTAPGDRSPGARIKKLREAAGLTLKQLAALIGTQTSQVWKLEHNQKRLTVVLIKKLAAALKCGPADIDPELGSSHRTVPLMGYIGKLDKYYPKASAGHWAPCGEVPAPPDIVEGVVALQVQGDDLYPTYCDGDVVYFVPKGSGSDFTNDGRHCIVQFQKGDMFLKLPNSNFDGEETNWTFDSAVGDPRKEAASEDLLLDWVSPILWVKRASRLDD